MSSHSYVPWIPFAPSHQPYARVENEFQNDQFLMSSFTSTGPNSNPNLSEYSHEISDGASIRSGTTPLLRQQNDFNSAENGSANSRVRRSQSRWQRYQGYRFGVTLCAALTGSVFLVNLTLTIWASKTFGLDGGVGTIQNGNCHRTKNLSLWLHLAINVLSTTLLSASNYCMQCLSSPTRQEVNKAHAKNKWLDIGVPSVRNLREITWRRIILWWLLAITSLPLHLLYNSAVFDTLTSYEYAAFTVSKEFLTGAPFNTYNVAEPQYDELRSRLDSLRNLNSNNSLERLENKDCMLRYGSTFNSRNLDVIAVSTQSDVTNSLLDATLAIGPTESFGSYSWLCSFHHERNKEFCDIEAAVKEAQRWTVALYPIDYCLSQPVVENCRLQFSLPIMLIVIICNLVKASCMVLIVLKERSQPLVIVGDAISSFLNEPDPATKNVCLADKYFFREEGWQARKMTWLPKRHRWFRAASLTRWLFCNVLCIITLITAIALLRKGLQNPKISNKSISRLWKMGFGAVSAETLIGIQLPRGNAGIMASVLLANAPQALLSFLYLTYNGLFSCMLLMEEWNGFAHERKTLRVTSPIGIQRSSYWLQLPYTYGIPLLVMSGILHWLVSQSIFLARVAVIDSRGNEVVSDSISTCGYSCIAIISVVILGSIMVISGVLTGSRRYREGMPLIGSCSAVISAACHALVNDPDAALMPVLWGAVESKGTAGHCCFTSFDVSPPVKGEVYAGEEKMLDISSLRDDNEKIVQRNPWNQETRTAEN